MEFWGVEVKSGQPLRVDPGEHMIVHISLAALGEKKGGNETVRLYMKVGDQKLVIGTLSHDKFPQLSTEIVLEKPFELSHSWKDGSVFFSGYKVDASDDTESDDDEPAVAGEPAVAKPGVKQVNFQLPNEDAKADDESDDDFSSDDAEDEEEGKKVTAEVDESDEDDEEDSSDDEEDDSSEEDTPEKAEASKKRPTEANTSKTASNKKAKFVTPQKTETKKPHVHVATPHPSKQGGKNSGGNGESSKQQQTPKSAGAFGCKSCTRTFTSEMGLQSHTKAKHSAAA